MDNNKTEDIKMQIYKLVVKFTYNQKGIIDILKCDDKIQDFICYAYTHYIDKIYPNFDPSKSALSTHVYACLNHLYMYFIIQTRYHVSFSTARAMLNSKNIKTKEFYNLLYNSKTLDTLQGGIDSFIESESDAKENIIHFDSSLADMTFEPYNYLYANVKAQTVEEIKNTAFGKVFDKYITRYFKSIKKPETKYQAIRDRDLIWEYTFRQDKHKSSLQSLGDKWDGISRERVRQIVSGFYTWLRKTKIREELEI